jgi:hypothetical protein
MSKITFFDLASVFNSNESTKEYVSVNKSIMTLSRCFKSLVTKTSNEKQRPSLGKSKNLMEARRKRERVRSVASKKKNRYLDKSLGKSKKIQRNSSASKFKKPARSVFFPYRESKLTKIMKGVWTGISDVMILGHLKYYAKEDDNAKSLEFLSKGMTNQCFKSRVVIRLKRF